MQVFKFGGASVKDAAAVKNVAQIIQKYIPEPLIIVVSAMGKTTNALETVFKLAYQKRDFKPVFSEIQNYHFKIAEELFLDNLQHPVFNNLQNHFNVLFTFLENCQTTDFDAQYDQVVGVGEIISSVIVEAYLNKQIKTVWLDCRQCICTDASWREAKVDWVNTEKLIVANVKPLLKENIVVTQGFLGGAANNKTTTLGREGSDFSGAIFAYCLAADGLTIWKDVDGLLNADPKYFANNYKYSQISYQETVEMAYYGATVIHPKTIKPLATRQIPLYVKSFVNPEAPGTVICGLHSEKIIPAFIRKENQCLISFGVRDYTFISEKNLSVIFHALAELRFKINLMQNSAISFSVCTNYDADRLQTLINNLQDQFSIHYNNPLLLFTIKNYDDESIRFLTEGKEILLEQRTRTTYQFACRES